MSAIVGEALGEAYADAGACQRRDDVLVVAQEGTGDAGGVGLDLSLDAHLGGQAGEQAVATGAHLTHGVAEEDRVDVGSGRLVSVRECRRVRPEGKLIPVAPCRRS